MNNKILKIMVDTAPLQWDIEKKEIYKKGIVNYGFLPILFLLKYCEGKENYEECKIIIETLNNYYKPLGISVPTKYNDESIEEYKESFWRLNMCGNTSLSNMAFYAMEIGAKINQLQHKHRKNHIY